MMRGSSAIQILEDAPETLVIRAEIAELPRVWDWADAIGHGFGLTRSTLFAVHLCLEEALSNIAHYGFADGQDEDGSKDVHVTLGRLDDAIVVTIEDRGIAFDPLAVAPPPSPASISEAPIGGRGIHLMRQFARTLNYEWRDGRNCLTLDFAYP